ncbi:MAG: hypothetical protein U1E35_03605 [Rhodospirillales bacterium]
MAKPGAAAPSHLLRRVFDECRSFASDEAGAGRSTAVYADVLLAGGIAAGRGLRHRADGRRRRGAQRPCVANHWTGFAAGGGHDRGHDSPTARRHAGGGAGW